MSAPAAPPSPARLGLCVHSPRITASSGQASSARSTAAQSVSWGSSSSTSGSPSSFMKNTSGQTCSQAPTPVHLS